MLTREEIKNYLPHREPMLLVDDMDLDGEMAVSHYHVRGDEFFLQGHFPGNPIVPGVILCEIMGQSSAILMLDELPGRLTLYTGLNEVRFRQPVHPGDTITVKARITSRKGLIFFIDATAYVDDKVACKGKLSFVLVDKDKE